MDIPHQTNLDGRRFSIADRQQWRGYLDYRRSDTAVLDTLHTFFAPAAHGRDVAEMLLHALINYASAEHAATRPSCRCVAQKPPLHYPRQMANNQDRLPEKAKP